MTRRPGSGRITVVCHHCWTVRRQPQLRESRKGLRVWVLSLSVVGSAAELTCFSSVPGDALMVVR